MELTHSKTEPSVRTRLIFSEAEVIIALIAHAERTGYVFEEGADVAVWFPHDNDRDTPTVKLVTDAQGQRPGISKQ